MRNAIERETVYSLFILEMYKNTLKIELSCFLGLWKFIMSGDNLMGSRQQSERFFNLYCI